MNMHRVSGMFFCTLLLCQVSLAQQTAHVEGALLLGEKRNIHAGAGRVSGCNWVEVLGGEGWLARSASDPPSGMRSLDVATRWWDAFLLRTIDPFIADARLWQRCYGQPLQSQRPQPPLLPPEQSLCAAIPSYFCPGQAVHAEKAL